MRSFDYLIVGAGFAGSVLAERLASEMDQQVLVVDRLPHVGGTSHDRYDDHGVLVHAYGPHIFHTNSAEVFEYLSRFTAWRPYAHRVLAWVDGQYLPIPINLDTVNTLYGLNLTALDLPAFLEARAERRDPIRTAEDAIVSKVGRDLYERFFRGYSRKQWGLDPSELDASVTARIPVRFDRNDRYFTDRYQAMPLHGYTRMFERMLAHPNVKVLLNADYREVRECIPHDRVIYTGPIDEFFDCCHGRLPYRSMQFRFETTPGGLRQPVAQVNYPNDHAYTRITEYRHLTGQAHEQTTVGYEYPGAEGDPHYPIPRPENQALYERYRAMAAELDDVTILGRLGTYRYLNMDQVVAQALKTFETIKAGRAARRPALVVAHVRASDDQWQTGS